MNHYFDTFATPLGPFSVAVDETGAIVATAFGRESALRQRARFGRLRRDQKRVATARAQILGYLAGRRRKFALPLAARGTPFQQRVWAALQQVPFGETRTYGGVAAAIGQPRAARAVGRANGANPICLVIPCHRVVGASGSLTGFAFGTAVKRRLLELEHAAIPSRR